MERDCVKDKTFQDQQIGLRCFWGIKKQLTIHDDNDDDNGNGDHNGDENGDDRVNDNDNDDDGDSDDVWSGI